MLGALDVTARKPENAMTVEARATTTTRDDHERGERTEMAAPFALDIIEGDFSRPHEQPEYQGQGFLPATGAAGPALDQRGTAVHAVLDGVRGDVQIGGSGLLRRSVAELEALSGHQRQ